MAGSTPTGARSGESPRADAANLTATLFSLTPGPLRNGYLIFTDKLRDFGCASISAIAKRSRVKAIVTVQWRPHQS